MRRRHRDPEPVRNDLRALLRTLKGRPRRSLDAATRAWGEVVGAALAARTRVVAVGGGFLTVEVASAALKHDLTTFRRQEVLSGLRARLPEMALQGVRYRIGRGR